MMNWKRILTGILASALMVGTGVADTTTDPLKMLLEGNQRFASGKTTHPNQGDARRGEVAQSQKPRAVILGCADSRVPPEVVFDQGLGDVFVVRSAGAIVDDFGLGSIEYAVAKLGARLIVVLGHERCGAVDAAQKGGQVPGHIGTILDAIRPAITASATEPGDPLDNAIRDTVKAVTAQLKASEPVLAPMVRDGSLRVVGLVYDLDNGVTRMVDGEPQP